MRPKKAILATCRWGKVVDGWCVCRVTRLKVDHKSGICAIFDLDELLCILTLYSRGLDLNLGNFGWLCSVRNNYMLFRHV